MNKQEADIEARKIFQERNEKANEIIRQAKKDGIWQMGLDSNRELFEELGVETDPEIEVSGLTTCLLYTSPSPRD